MTVIDILKKVKKGNLKPEDAYLMILNLFDISGSFVSKFKVGILTEALEDVANWNDDLKDAFEDPGYRAFTALEEFNRLNEI